MKIAACAYRPRWHDTWKDLSAQLDDWVSNAAHRGAELLLFPEYAGCEAALLAGGPKGGTPLDWAKAMANHAEDYAQLVSNMAQNHGVTIIAGSLVAQGPSGLVNRAYVAHPNGALAFQDKLILTPYERDHMQLVGGDQVNVFTIGDLRFGILICYDSEFPLLARQLIEADVQMILVPSATDFAAGHTRVRQSCRARAIEGQCLVIQAPVLGRLPDCDVLDSGTGNVGFFGPPDYGLPSDGILYDGELDQSGWVIQDVDPAAIAAPRHSGQVGNVAHWPEQQRHIKPAHIIELDSPAAPTSTD